jgi:tRNA(Ile)-lysidine synthase
MHVIERTLLASLLGPCGVTPEQKGVVAVSGGPDSMALLHGLLTLRQRLRLRLEVAHFDHGLRPESAWEAEWVVTRMRQAGLLVHVRRATHLARLTHGVQAAARTWRRGELLRLREAIRADWVATGHQRDDQLETLLLKLLRGAHLGRLHGMEWRAGPFIRPLLGVPRGALLDYLRECGVKWLEDPSNASPLYRRNRVRHELLPLLDELAGGAIAARLEALERQSRQLAGWLESLPPPPQGTWGRGAAWIAVAGLRRLPVMARAHALERFIQRHAPGEIASRDLDRALTLLEAPAGPRRYQWTLTFAHGRRLERRGARLLLRTAQPPTPATHRLDDVRITAPAAWRVTGGRGIAGGTGLILANIPAGAHLEARTRREGDRFHPPWRDHPVKVKDFLRDQHIPLWERDQLPLVVLNGQVIAIYPRFIAWGFLPPGREPPFMLHIATADSLTENAPGEAFL